MLRLTTNNAELLHTRLNKLDSNDIVGFPDTNDDRVMRMKAYRNIGDGALLRRVEAAKRDVDKELLGRYPNADWPTGLRKQPVHDWRSLETQPYLFAPIRCGIAELTSEGRQQFTTQFNTLMNTAQGEGWLLGFGWMEDNLPPGDFGEDPPIAEFCRILVPQAPGNMGLREVIGGGLSVEQALQETIVTLGSAAIEN